VRPQHWRASTNRCGLRFQILYCLGCRARTGADNPVPRVEAASQNGQCRFCCLGLKLWCLGLGIKNVLDCKHIPNGTDLAHQSDEACAQRCVEVTESRGGGWTAQKSGRRLVMHSPKTQAGVVRRCRSQRRGAWPRAPKNSRIVWGLLANGRRGVYVATSLQTTPTRAVSAPTRAVWQPRTPEPARAGFWEDVQPQRQARVADIDCHF